MKEKSLIFTVSDIFENCEPSYFERGFSYFKKHMVASCQFTLNTPKMLSVESSVYGSRDQLYMQYITVQTLANGKKNILGDCSCPVEFNCKHVVAVLLYVLELQKNTISKSQREIEAWLGKFHKKDPVLFNRQNAEDIFIYRIFIKEPHIKYLSLDFYKTRVLKKGGYGKEYAVNKSNLFYDSYQYSYLTEKDLEIIKLLKPLRGDFYPYEISFEGELGAIALKKILNTGRCYLGNSDRALKFDKKTISPEFFWKDEKNGKKRISSNLDQAGMILPTEPIYYIDPKSETICEVQTEHDVKTLTLLSTAPEVDKDDLDFLMTESLEVIPEVELPMPKEFELEEIVTMPVPHLFLRNFTQSDGKVIHFIALSFIYDVYQTHSYPQRNYFLNLDTQKRFKIIRDLKAEEDAILELKGLGFTQDDMQDPSSFFSFADPDMQTAIERWRILLEEKVQVFQKRGWKVIIEDDFDFKFNYIDDIFVDAQESSTHSWFDVMYEVSIAGEKRSLLPIVTALLEEYDSAEQLPPKLNIRLENGEYLHVDSAKIKPILQTLFELFDSIEEDKIKLKHHDAHLISGFEDNNIQYKGSRELKALSQKLRSFTGIEQVDPSLELQANLRNYQQFGLSWLNFLHEYRFGGILADDMGLGKTLQTLAFLQKLKSVGNLNKPTLVVMPTSLIGNWKNEIEKFTPDLSYLALYGSDRAKLFTEVDKYDLLLTTYQLTLRDQEKLQNIEFLYLVLDEAQKIKNHKAKMTIAIKSLHAEHKLALSGTPMENHLAEVWSIFDFLMPGFLGNLTFFKQYYQNPIEKEHDLQRQEQLKKKIMPFMLRRTKEEVLKELPKKVEIIQKVTFGDKQALLYENIRLAMEKRVTDVIKSKGLSRSHITILDALLKLRQICCDPALLSMSEAKKVKDSAKKETLFELLEELLAENRKILLFSQFTTMLSIIEDEVKKRKINYAKLTGQTRKREEAIAKFKQDDCNLFLISLKAGGVGLNLTEADTIIHYDPWWNPAVENQATDRAHRIGQTKTVFVYKLVVENSIEEKIITLQDSKKELYKGLYDKTKEEKMPFQGDDLIALLRQ